jgi:hypothetical protein
LNNTIDNCSELKKEIYYEGSILQKNLSDLQLFLEKINTSTININNTTISKSSSNNKFASISHKYPQSKLENQVDVDTESDNEIINEEKRDFDEDTNIIKINQDNINNSINELKSLENEIFIALKKLENTESKS